MTTQTRLTTPPIADNWRAFAVTDYANAHPPEGFVERTRLSAPTWSGGVPYLTATHVPDPILGHACKSGWRRHAGLAGNRPDPPCFFQRALFMGHDASGSAARHNGRQLLNEGHLSRWDRSRSLSGTLSYLPFTDGNQRFNAGAVLTQKVISVPHFDLTATGEVFTSAEQPPVPHPTTIQTMTLRWMQACWRSTSSGGATRTAGCRRCRSTPESTTRLISPPT